MNILAISLSCNDPVIGTILPMIKRTISIFQIVVPILLIIGITFSFAKLLVNPEEKTEPKKIANRIVATFIIFLSPFLLNYLMAVISEYANVTTYNIATCWHESQNAQFKVGGSLEEGERIYVNDQTIYEESTEQSYHKESTTSSSGTYSKDVEGFMKAVEEVYKKAHESHLNGPVKTIYGDSRTSPPVELDSLSQCQSWNENNILKSDERCILISCDRLPAKALWMIGYTDQPQGGIVIGTMTNYLKEHGFQVSTSKSAIKRGSIVLVGGSNGPTHTFVMASYDPKTEKGLRYDAGSNRRIAQQQPTMEPVLYPGSANGKLYAVFNLP